MLINSKRITEVNKDPAFVELAVYTGPVFIKPVFSVTVFDSRALTRYIPKAY